MIPSLTKKKNHPGMIDQPQLCDGPQLNPLTFFVYICCVQLLIYSTWTHNSSETKKLLLIINMKSYLFALLLFLLLVNKSHSPPLPRFKIPFPKGAITKGFRHAAIEYIWYKTLNWIKKHEFPPPPPNAPAEEIQGLSVVKEYLNQFGYINYSDSFTDYLDQETLQAIELYQEFFNLKVTGQLDNETLTQISLPRCGVPDLNFTYDLTTTNNLSWPKGNHWFPTATSTKVLTYGFLPASEIPTNMTDVFRVAFQRWSEAIGVLNLTEATSFDAADIKVGFYAFNNNSTFQDLLVGDVVIALEQSGSDVRIVGDMRLDATKFWVIPSYNGTWSWQDGNFDLETVAMHQIGHLLGLDHSFIEESVMYPYILPSQQKKVQLTDKDKESIQQLYSNTSSGDGGRFTNGWGLLTTLSLGFACTAMMY